MNLGLAVHGKPIGVAITRNDGLGICRACTADAPPDRVQEGAPPLTTTFTPRPAEGDYVSVEVLLSMVTGVREVEPPTQ